MTIIILLAAMLIAAPAVAGELGGTATVTDGDTIKVDGIPVRLAGIDAPERDQICTLDGAAWRCGDAATAALRLLAEGQAVWCETDGVDGYRRIVARCFVGTLDLNARMVRYGWALDYTKYSGGAYVDQQAEAAAERIGLWASTFVQPWEWRAAR